MRYTPPHFLQASPALFVHDLVSIRNATFYRNFPAALQPKSPPLFRDLTFSLPVRNKSSSLEDFWAVVGPSSSGKTTFLQQVLLGGLICLPPSSRSYPYLSDIKLDDGDSSLRNPRRALQYVGFGNANDKLSGPSAKGAYLSARYESRRESTDFSLLDYLRGSLSLNPSEEELQSSYDSATTVRVSDVAELLRLSELLQLPVGNLSNGQTRRARIAKALLQRPLALLLDEPFLGLDPRTTRSMMPLLQSLAVSSNLQIVLSLDAGHQIPEWITHILYLGKGCTIRSQGPKDQFSAQLSGQKPSERPISRSDYSNKVQHSSVLESDSAATTRSSGKDCLVQMEGVRVTYGTNCVIGNWTQFHDGLEREGLLWNIKRGDRWGLFGPNGSGKSTLSSLMASDHPQTYSLPIKLFGRSRLPTPQQPGISIFDIQARIGQSSPETYSFFPQNHTIRRTIESAWADTFVSKPALDQKRHAKVDACLRLFRPELDPGSTETPSGSPGSHDDVHGNLEWANESRFCDVSFSAQKVALLIRALIKKPDLVILDEAFSGMDDLTRRKCMTFLELGIPAASVQHGGGQGAGEITGLEERQALLCVSHRPDELPRLVSSWICLPDAGSREAPRFGVLDVDRDLSDTSWWDRVWGLS